MFYFLFLFFTSENLRIVVYWWQPRMCLCACVWTLCNSQASVARRDENKIIGFLIYCDTETDELNITARTLNRWKLINGVFGEIFVKAKFMRAVLNVPCHRIRFHWIGQSAPIFTFVFVSAVIEYLPLWWWLPLRCQHWRYPTQLLLSLNSKSVYCVCAVLSLLTSW